MSSARSLSDLLRCLQRDEPVLFPTDTVPALAIRPTAAERIWALKERPPDKPLILMGANLSQLQQTLATDWAPEWQQEAQSVWPGAVTLVFPLTGPLQQALNPGGTTLGLRVPACPMAQELLRYSGPLATTSVNRSGQPPALTDREASQCFPELALLGPLPWPAASGLPSEVRGWTPSGWQVLRARQTRLI
ncbi:MAG: L-threonylcarbamoyladenylate synthase [Cyanobacteriota bacterium]|nr:L-threonylcarbamoyladenylate synthase [Cyanobacteriota bacterium]